MVCNWCLMSRDRRSRLRRSAAAARAAERLRCCLCRRSRRASTVVGSAKPWMMRKGATMRYRSALFALLLLLAPTASSAQSYGIQGTERYFRLEWEASTARRGPVISGYVYNISGTAADRMRLAIDTLDGAGQVTASVIGYVLGTVPAGEPADFRIALPPAAE